ncbi:LOW QUALITY PROTEIN: protein IQ-DOMAIN 8-like, partial [Rutidosis leptorrhynchoides]|uniref:LOW QUALITY PROTEIN: protein IQ-DOMAIN 8-like n=1 Tax=Rutidosis leptorrhynchoides TaxID=125765 RepID=UPI003A98F093
CQARQALRALKAVVRIQAIFRGRLVRKQAAITLRCMQALVRVQERMRLQSAAKISQEQNMQNNQTDPIKHAEQGWCNSPGTVDEVRAKIQMRQEGAIKRERAIAYTRSQNQSRSCPSPNRRTINRSGSAGKNNKKMMDDKSNINGLNWVERWMASKPWENRLMDPEMTRKSDDNSNSSEMDSVNVRRNNVTTKISARPPQLSFSDEFSTTTSSASLSPIPKSTNNLQCLLGSSTEKPSYMNLTTSTKAKLRANYQQHSSSNDLLLQSHRNSSSSNPSKDLYPPIPMGRHDLVTSRNWSRYSSKDRYGEYFD